MTSAIRFPARGYVPPMAAPKRLLEPEGAKAVPTINFPPELFWRSTGDVPDLNAPQIRGLMAYRLSALAYACMSYRATKLTEPPLWVKEEIDGQEQWLEAKDVDSDFARLLEEPNPDMDMADLIELTSLLLDGTGRVIWVKTRDRGNRVAALYAFGSDEFTIEAGDQGLYQTFRVNTSRGVKTYGPDDVIFWKNTDPRNPLDGLAPLDVALASVNIDEDMRQAVRAMLRNKIRPGAIAFFPDGQSDEAYERNKLEVAANFAGARNAGKLMTLEGAGELKLLESSLKDLALGPVNENAEAAVCSAFKIHPAIIHALIGIKNSSGFADTIKPATDLAYDTVFVPTWTRFEKKLTKSLLREADPNKMRFIRFDTSNVAALKDDLVARTQEATNAGKYWTIDERRKHTGQPPLDKGDPRADSFDGTAATPTGTAVEPQPAPGKSSAVQTALKDAPAPVETKQDARQRLWAKADVRARRAESAYEHEALIQFEKEKAAAEKTLSGHELDAALKIIAAKYAKDAEYHREWAQRFADLIKKSVKIGAEDLAAETGFDFTLENPKVQKAIQSRINKLSGNVTNTTYQQLLDEVSKGRAAGESSAEIAKRIRENVFGGEITKNRATMIARTETIGALNEGEYLSALESGVMRSKEWLSQGDSRVRHSHQQIDGTRIPIQEDFSNGLLYPGDQRGAADEVIQCRCTLLFHDEEAP